LPLLQFALTHRTKCRNGCSRSHSWCFCNLKKKQKKLVFAPPFDFEKKIHFEAVLRIRIRIDFGRLDPDPGGLKRTTKKEKVEEFHV